MRTQDMTLPWPPPRRLVDPNHTLPLIAEYTAVPKTGIQVMNDKYGHEADTLWRGFLEKAKSAESRGAAIEWTMALLTCAAHWRCVADDTRAGVQVIEEEEVPCKLVTHRAE